MSDEQMIKDAVNVARERGVVIDHGTARAIASQYNDGGDTWVYSFVSTGAIHDGDAATLWRNLTRGVDDRPESLSALGWYLKSREESGDFDPVPGWSDMWVKPAEEPKNPFLCPHCGKLAVKDFNTNAEVKAWGWKTETLTLDCENCGARVTRNTECGKSNSWELATDTLPTYDVWIFSPLPEYVPRGGVVSITSGLPLERARAMRDKENARDHYSAQVYVMDTRKRVK